jgi:protein PhnA
MIIRYVDTTTEHLVGPRSSRGAIQPRARERPAPRGVMMHGSMDVKLPPCPECKSELTYEDRGALICPECGHEWSADAVPPGEASLEVRDAHGTPLHDGDTVMVIKDLKIKGSSSVVKIGTKVKNIRLVEGDHDIDCKIPGIGAMGLRSQFVKKV